VYGELGVRLWTGLSTISAPGLRRWLSAFGVRHFETQEPSDLEYDPQLVVVAEWRDAGALMQDHIDNAAIDAMLEGAQRGDGFSSTWPGPRRRRCAGRVRRRTFNLRLLPSGARSMPKGEERRLAALAKKNAAKAAKAKPNKRRQYDDTLPPEREEDVELRDFFSEMKKREF